MVGILRRIKMPFCPVCRYEYEPKVSLCPDCEETVVATLPTDEAILTASQGEWRPLCLLKTGMYGDMARSALESKDIPSVVMAQPSGSVGKGLGIMGGLTSSGGGGEILMVPEQFVSDARLLLTGILGEDFIEIETNPT